VCVLQVCVQYKYVCWASNIMGLKPNEPTIYTNILPQTQGGDEEAILSLDTRSRKRPGGWDLVNTSVSWSLE
jgi:hypothetical protein